MNGKMFISIPVGLFAVVLKGDKREKLELYGDGGDRGQCLIPRVSGFVLCAKAEQVLLRRDDTYTHFFLNSRVAYALSQLLPWRRARATCFV